MDECGAAGGDEEPQGKGIQILRAGMQMLTMYQARKRGGTEWMKLAKYILWNAEEHGGLGRAGLLGGGEGDRGCQICSTLWTDNFWIMS